VDHIRVSSRSVWLCLQAYLAVPTERVSWPKLSSQCAKVCNSYAPPTKVENDLLVIQIHGCFESRAVSLESRADVAFRWIYPVFRNYCGFLQLYALQTFAHGDDVGHVVFTTSFLLTLTL
jgi:hypothetical protein